MTAPSDPAEWSRTARAEYRHYLSSVFPSGDNTAIRSHQARLAAMVPLLCDAIDALIEQGPKPPADTSWIKTEDR